MRFYKRAQAAMEFLMTYGWAILVVLAAVAALAYFGVLSPDKFLPEKCTLSTGITCTGFKVTSDSFTLVLTNNFGKDIELNSVNVGGCLISGINESLKNNKISTITQTGCSFGNSGDRVSADISIGYTEKLTGLTKTRTGTLNSKIQPGSMGGQGEEEQEGSEDSGLSPVTLTPSLAESYQDEGTPQNTVTTAIVSLDDDWAPKMTGSVNIPYYATGSSNRYFDALAVKFNVAGYAPESYDGILRFYLKGGPYSGGWHHYKIYDSYKDNSECEDSSPPCGSSPSFADSFEGWIEVSIDDSYWDDGELSIRLWDAYIDKVELYLVPQ
ncbi:MAG: hypothetical protein U9R34_06350 [Nanoarchaeota archaeon]|nr:hypothetical protein [Nanoarchaeota archaeon]